VAANEDNFAYSTYVSDDGRSYAVRTLSFWAALAASGGTTTSANPLYGRESRRRHVRKAKFADLTASGRFVTLPVFTAAAYTALVPGTTTISRSIRGEAAAKTYTLVKLIPEAVPSHVITSSAAQGT
jgi:hypothetical protein